MKNSKQTTTSTMQTPTGEQIFELIGKNRETGNTINHSVAHIIIPPNKSSASHYHKVSEETYYVLSGNGKVILDEKEVLLSKGDIFLIKQSEIHQIFNIDEKIDLEFLAVSAPAWDIEDSYFV